MISMKTILVLVMVAAAACGGPSGQPFGGEGPLGSGGAAVMVDGGSGGSTAGRGSGGHPAATGGAGGRPSGSGGTEASGGQGLIAASGGAGPDAGAGGGPAPAYSLCPQPADPYDGGFYNGGAPCLKYLSPANPYAAGTKDGLACLTCQRPAGSTEECAEYDPRTLGYTNLCVNDCSECAFK